MMHDTEACGPRWLQAATRRAGAALASTAAIAAAGAALALYLAATPEQTSAECDLARAALLAEDAQ